MNKSLYLIYPESAESGTIETLPPTEGLELVKEDYFLENYSTLPSSQKVCITSEATLDSILKGLSDQAKKMAIQSMKDKHLFRKLLQEEFPGIKYDFIHLVLCGLSFFIQL